MTTTPHLISPEEIMAYLDHELTPSQNAIIGEHIALCTECAALAEDLRGISATLSSWTVPPIPVQIQQNIFDPAQAAPSLRAVGRRWLAWLIGAPVVAVLLVMAFIVTRTLTLQPHPLKDAVVLERHSESYALQPNAPPAALQARQSRASFDDIGTYERASMAIMAPPMIAHTAALTVQVKSMTTARSTLDQILSRHKGYFAEMNISGADSSSPILTSSLRIPAEELPLAMKDLKSLGKVLNESQSGEEVGKQHADLLARLKTSRETEERFRAILQQRTGSVADILEVEQAIARTRGEIESMEAEQQSLEHRVNFASVQVNLNEPTNDSPTDSIGLHNRNSVVAGYHNAIGTFLGVVYFLEEYGPPILIWVIILGLPAYLLLRRYHRNHSQL